MNRIYIAGGIVFCLVILLVSLSTRVGEVPAQAEAELPMAAGAVLEPVQPLPARTNLDDRKVALGRRLFHDPQFSRDNRVACVSCHSLKTGGVDRLVRSKGTGGRLGAINAPTVFNCAYNFRQFWDGRAADLVEQIDGPVHNPDELGSSAAEITAKLSRSPTYVADFRAIYPDGLRWPNVKDAIVNFEWSLNTPGGRFDRYLRGDRTALTAAEKEGYRLFKSYGCASCHQGVNAGGNMYQRFGVMGDYFADRGHVTRADLGRFNVTGDARDRYVFKVPGLRNVELTPPYFHDGSVATLDAAVMVMGKYQLGRTLSTKETALLVAFLRTLTGPLPGER
jgi:cytochrome c peroxidase